MRETRWEIGFRGLGSLGSKKKMERRLHNHGGLQRNQWLFGGVAFWGMGLLGEGGWYVGEAYGKYNIIMAIDNVKGYACLVLARV